MTPLQARSGIDSRFVLSKEGILHVYYEVGPQSFRLECAECGRWNYGSVRWEPSLQDLGETLPPRIVETAERILREHLSSPEHEITAEESEFAAQGMVAVGTAWNAVASRLGLTIVTSPVVARLRGGRSPVAKIHSWRGFVEIDILEEALVEIEVSPTMRAEVERQRRALNIVRQHGFPYRIALDEASKGPSEE